VAYGGGLKSSLSQWCGGNSRGPRLWPSERGRGLLSRWKRPGCGGSVREVDASTLGIEGVSVRNGVDGEKIVEVPGPDAEGKADRLAEALRGAEFGGMVNVTRPSKTLDLRLSGLEDAIGAEEVLSALAASSGCDRGVFRLGSFGPGRRGLRSIWVRAPAKVSLRQVPGPLEPG